VDVGVRMSECGCAERKRRERLCGSRLKWHETRETKTKKVHGQKARARCLLSSH